MARVHTLSGCKASNDDTNRLRVTQTAQTLCRDSTHGLHLTHTTHTQHTLHTLHTLHIYPPHSTHFPHTPHIPPPHTLTLCRWIDTLLT